MGRPVIHFEARGRDGAKLRSFYTELFGWTNDADNPLDHGFVQLETSSGDVGVPGGTRAVPHELPGRLTFYVEVPDVAAVLARAEELGGTRLMCPTAVLPV